MAAGRAELNCDLFVHDFGFGGFEGDRQRVAFTTAAGMFFFAVFYEGGRS